MARLPDIHADPLIDLLARSLTAPAVSSGARLLPEQQLLANLGISRWRLRKAVDRLVHQGVLIRRQGSGTFVHRPAPEDPNQPHPPIAATLLLSENAQSAAPSAAPIPILSGIRDFPTTAFPGPPPPLHGRPLTLGLLHLPADTLTVAPVPDAFERTCRAMGHTPRSYALTGALDQPVDASQLQAAFQTLPCDGYVVMADWAQALHERPTDPMPPLILYGNPGTQGHPWPAIRYHGSLGVQHGLRELAADYRRPGLIALTGSIPRYTALNQATHRRAFETGLERAGLPPSDRIAFTQGGVAQSSVEAFAVTRQLLDRPDPPDALYVTDDHLLYGILEALKQAGRRAGDDFGLITYCARGADLPPGLDWSRFEIDYRFPMRLAIDLLAAAIHGQEPPTEQILIAPRWVPGQTHRRA